MDDLLDPCFDIRLIGLVRWETSDADRIVCHGRIGSVEALRRFLLIGCEGKECNEDDHPENAQADEIAIGEGIDNSRDVIRTFAAADVQTGDEHRGRTIARNGAFAVKVSWICVEVSHRGHDIRGIVGPAGGNPEENSHSRAEQDVVIEETDADTADVLDVNIEGQRVEGAGGPLVVHLPLQGLGQVPVAAGPMYRVHVDLFELVVRTAGPPNQSQDYQDGDKAANHIDYHRPAAILVRSKGACLTISLQEKFVVAHVAVCQVRAAGASRDPARHAHIELLVRESPNGIELGAVLPGGAAEEARECMVGHEEGAFIRAGDGLVGDGAVGAHRHFTVVPAADSLPKIDLGVVVAPVSVGSTLQQGAPGLCDIDLGAAEMLRGGRDGFSLVDQTSEYHSYG
mmetsp:Transcript_48020/g.102888  ORF Transcript_48020/g.102888 Transcript_48020/m.102888 type:complete len:399 (-) Transcript_48020:140-1336(-)